MTTEVTVRPTSRYDRVPQGLARYTCSDWDRALGNHRALVRVATAADVAYVWLPWRRRDAFPQAKRVMVVDAQTGRTVKNSVVVSCNREYGEVVFQPISGVGDYLVYYLIPTADRHRWTWPRSSFPVTMYEPPRTTAVATWMAAHRVGPDETGSTPDPRRVAWVSSESRPAPWRDLPEAELVEFQSRGEWHSFYPMEVCATLDERLQVAQRSGGDFLVFPECQTRPIRMTHDLPYHWAVRERDQLFRFVAAAQRHEYFVFQIGVYAHRQMLANVSTTWTPLRRHAGGQVPAEAITCFNLAGIDQHGRAFARSVHVGFQQVQAMWFGIDIAADTRPGVYEGEVTITAQDCQPQVVHLRLQVEDTVAVDRGDGDLDRMSRLRWLNSIHAQDDEVCAPYTPVRVKGRTVQILGRCLELDEGGLPTQCTSYIDMFTVRSEGRAILAAPVRFEAWRAGRPLRWRTTRPAASRRLGSGKVRFRSEQAAAGLTRQTEVTVEMDGRIGVRLTLAASRKLDLDGLRLSVALPAEVARYWLEAAPPSWVASRSRLATVCPDATQKPLAEFSFAWVGDYNAGMTVSLAPSPAAWLCGTDGMFRQTRSADGTCSLAVDTGALTLMAGQSLDLEFALYVTPFKPLSPEHWGWRYCHEGYGKDLDVRRGIEAGAKVFIQHQGSPKCPYINYLFPVAGTLKAMADQVHAVGGRFKAYNTIREQSTRTRELWALRSLGHEILLACTGHLGYESMAQLPLEYQLRNQVEEPFTGQLWMCEHLGDDYHARWHSTIAAPGGPTLTEDSSLQISGASRWSNFYIESQRWLMAQAGVDGLYLDGVTFDRASFLRVRKTMVRQKPEALIDWHGSPADIMDFVSLVDSLWFGEGADYSREDAYWLVAVSGIPFGVPGELLQGEASVHRGMVYGVSQRYAWVSLDHVDPSGLWRWWDDFDIAQATMRGYWAADCPVQCSHPAVKATAYVHHGRRLAIALASWAPEQTDVRIAVDWAAVGLDPVAVRVTAPEIAMFQPGLPAVSLDAVSVAPGKGWILVVER
jgi:hypothetical protein